MRLFQIPFSHNCVKVRHVLDLKGLEYDAVNINPLLRGEVKRLSGQMLVPMLIDRGRVVSDSTPILLYIEEHHPDPPLLPADLEERAECIVLMDWADATFMALTRRLAYFQVVSAPATVGELFFPQMPAGARRAAGSVAAQAVRIRFRISPERNVRDEELARRAARIVVQRLGGADHLVGGQLTLADITLAAMAAPLQYTPLREDPDVRTLLQWGAGVLGTDFSPLEVPAPAAA